MSDADAEATRARCCRFDSGSSWAGVLNKPGLTVPADLYLEGSDQHRGRPARTHPLHLLPTLNLKPVFSVSYVAFLQYATRLKSLESGMQGMGPACQGAWDEQSSSIWRSMQMAFSNLLHAALCFP